MRSEHLPVILRRGLFAAVFDDAEGRVAGVGHSLLIVGPFGLGDGRQHPVGQIVIGVRLRADADLDARELVGAEAGDDGFQAVVAAGRAVFADAELADGESSKRTSTRSGGIL